jgi:hypothetical protein
MTGAVTKRKLYCFDTSAFLTLSRTSENVIEMPKALWDQLETMMRAGEVISHRLVFDEISSDTKSPDFITQWIVDKEKYFLDITPVQISLVPEIVKACPGLIDYQMEREQADTWLIALAIERAREQGLFHSTISIVVSQESKVSSKKIPAACKAFNVEHRSLREFFDEIGFSAALQKNQSQAS